MCDPQSDTWITLIPTLDVIIEAIGGSADISTLSNIILQSVVNAAKTTRAPGAPKLTFIYTSGTWVHGESRTEIATDTTPISSPVELVKWRPNQEQTVIRESAINGIVIRPSMVYGRSGSIISGMFREAEAAKKEGRKMLVPGTFGRRLALVHADDLGEFYLLAAEKSVILGGLILDASNDLTESVDDFLEKLTILVGVKDGFGFRKPENRKSILKKMNEQ